MIKYSRPIVALVVAAASGLAFGFVSAKADPQSRYNAAVKRVDTQFQAQQTRCTTLPREQVRLCLAVALSEKWRDLAEAQVRLHDTPEARRSQRVIAAGGDLLVELQKCSARAAGDQDGCRDSAKDLFLRELSRVRVMEAKDQSCQPGGCAWLPQSLRQGKTTSL